MRFKHLFFIFFIFACNTHANVPLETTVDRFNAEKEHIHKGIRNGMSTVDYFTNFVEIQSIADFSDDVVVFFTAQKRQKISAGCSKCSK